MNNTFDAGAAFVATNLTTISNALISNAAQGKTTFTVNIVGTGTVDSSYLRANNGKNLLLKAFLAGISSGLASQDIYNYECLAALNTATTTTGVDFNFTFQTS